jgi:hypothetical protein
VLENFEGAGIWVAKRLFAAKDMIPSPVVPDE